MFVALALLAAGCGSPNRGASRANEHVVAIQDLPAAQREVLEAYGRGGDLWDEKRAAVLADPKLASFLVDNLVLEMMRGYDVFAAQGDVRARDAYLRAQNELSRFPAQATPVLAHLLAGKDGIVADLAAKTLTLIGKPSVAAADALLANTDWRIRRRAADLLAALPYGGIEAEERARRDLVERALHDDQWIVRAQAAAALGARGSRDTTSEPWRAALERVLADPDPTVRRSAAEALRQLGDRRSIPALANALAHAAAEGDLKALRTIQDALRALSGTSSDLEPQAWLDWWQKFEVEDARRQAKRK